MTFDYDIAVVGAGAAGLNVASFMNKAGFKVLLIEREEARVGGDCLNVGCIPSKALIHAAREVATAKASGRWGLT
ncbi:FAD-dependent oxidoreductase, partial [Patescibacteria group bacterium]|nr:FAD-dependent oxidoreductase [Patescibacteria group bacterium]